MTRRLKKLLGFREKQPETPLSVIPYVDTTPKETSVVAFEPLCYLSPSNVDGHSEQASKAKSPWSALAVEASHLIGRRRRRLVEEASNELLNLTSHGAVPDRGRRIDSWSAVRDSRRRSCPSSSRRNLPSKSARQKSCKYCPFCHRRCNHSRSAAAAGRWPAAWAMNALQQRKLRRLHAEARGGLACRSGFPVQSPQLLAPPLAWPCWRGPSCRRSPPAPPADRAVCLGSHPAGLPMDGRFHLTWCTRKWIAVVAAATTGFLPVPRRSCCHSFGGSAKHGSVLACGLAQWMAAEEER